MYNEAIVLAGGMGTRLSKVINDVPKPMAGINGKPFLEFLLSYLVNNGISHIILSVGYKSEIIKEHFGLSFKGAVISYACETSPLGTGGGIKLALEKTKGKQVYVLNGDTLFNIDLKILAQSHSTTNAKLTIALRIMEDGARFGSVEVDKLHQITAFHEKNENAKSVLINGGIYLIDKTWMLNKTFPDKFSFEKDILEKEFKNEKFYGIPFNDYFIDIGIPTTYQQAQTDFLNEFSSR
jgi:D-glycero-alpha-D-manno-heptose 1-phosphate guanylyltransferase